jgi:hypothetical protein
MGRVATLNQGDRRARLLHPRRALYQRTGSLTSCNNLSTDNGFSKALYAFSLIHKSGLRYTITPHSAPPSAQGIPKISLLQGTSQMRVLSLTTLLLLTTLGFSQSATSLRGRVTDPSHAVVPGAQVSLTSLTTGGTREQVTRSDGGYEFPQMQPGKYSLRVSASGFQPISKEASGGDAHDC